MGTFTGVTDLELAELYAAENNEISSEEEASEHFDEHIAPNIVAEYGEDDEPAMNEGFSNWIDSLTKDGSMHEYQANNYCYVGKYS